MSPRPRHVIGPLLVGIAVWCAAGQLTVGTPDAASPRLAIPAAWWMLPLAAGVAALVAPWRRRPLTALPAMLSTLPWWPLPLPPVALIWTGPLAWLPILAAAVCAAGSAPLAGLARVLRAADARRATALSALATLLVGALVAWNVDAHLPAGDEPHYLVITQSLLHDRDLRIENNHRQRDYAEYFAGGLEPDYLRRGRDGEIYSIHAPGLPAVVLPAFALFGYRGVEALLLVFAAATASLVWRIGWRATGDAPSAWFAWAAIAGSATFLLHSYAVFPDGPGALVVAASVLLLLRLRTAPGAVGAGLLTLVSLLLALMPWLHTRFVVLAAGLGVLIAAGLLVEVSRPPAARFTRAAMFLVIPCASAVGWFAFFQAIYGTPNPSAPYGANEATRLRYIPGGLTGLLFDEQFGLFAYAPILIAAAAGLFQTGRAGVRSVAMSVGAVAMAYLATAASYWMWWAGLPANPARFAAAALPALAIPLASVWFAASADVRRTLVAVLGGSLAISAVTVGVQGGDLAWNMRSAEALWLGWLGPVVDLPRAWPSFFWKLDPDVLRSEWPFVLHATVFLAVVVLALVVATFATGKSQDASRARVIVAAALLVGLMAAAQMGWWVNGVEGLDAAPSQTAVLSAGGQSIEIAPFAIRRVTTLEERMSIGGKAIGRTDGPAPWLLLERVPAGEYELRVSTSRPRAGQLLVEVAPPNGAAPRIAVAAQNRQTIHFSLPVNADRLIVMPDADLAPITGRIELTPVRLRNPRLSIQHSK